MGTFHSIWWTALEHMIQQLVTGVRAYCYHSIGQRSARLLSIQIGGRCGEGGGANYFEGCLGYTTNHFKIILSAYTSQSLGIGC